MKPKINRTGSSKPAPGEKDVKIPVNKTLKTSNIPDWFKKIKDVK
jgi:hypothetical protein